MAESGKQIRVMLWSPPRTLSTVFEKCMSYVDDIQIINEAYQSAGVNDPERMKAFEQDMQDDFKGKIDKFKEDAEEVQLTGNIAESGWDSKVCTAAWVKNLLEGEFPGKKVVFAKDLITGISGQFHMLPKGYRHTFLIRNPTKMFISLRRNMLKLFPSPDGQFSMLAMPTVLREFYQPMLQLIDYVKKNEGETNPIIIDADDLQDHPGSVVRQYCQAVSIPYKESLLEWPAGDSCVKKNWLVSKIMLQGDQLMGYYAAAFASTKFLPSKSLPPESEIPADVIEVAKCEEQYYKQLYDMRIKP